MFGMIGLLTMSVFCGSSLMWLICPAPSVICLPYHLKFLTLFVVFIGGWLGYEIARFVIGDGLFSIYYYGASSFAGSMWFIPFFSTYGVSFGPLGVGYMATRCLSYRWFSYEWWRRVWWIVNYKYYII